MADGKIVFSTKIDSSSMDKELKEIEKKIEKAEETITESENKKIPLVEEADELGAKLDEAKYKAERLREEMAKIREDMAPGATPGAFIEAGARESAAAEELAKQEKEVERLQKEWDAINDKVDKYDEKIRVAKETIREATTQAAALKKENGGAGNAMKTAIQKAGDATANFKKQIVSMAKSALIFSVIAKAFEAIRNYMGKMLKTNQQFTAKLNELKAALATAFQPLYETIVPGLIVAMDVLTDVVNVLASVLSAMFGKTLSESAKAAKALNDEAEAMENLGNASKKTAKNMAGFDEINTMGSGDSGALASMAFDRYTDEYKAKIQELSGILIGALFTIGAFLTITGLNVGLGVAMMIAGGLALYGSAKANGELSQELRKGLAECMTVIGGALFVIGAIMAVLGFSLPIGIALMVAGAASLVSAAVSDWNAMANIIREHTEDIITISGLLLVLGLILALSGATLPLGIALIAAGAAGMVATVAANWNSIVTALQGPLGAIVGIVGGALLVIGIILLFTGVGIPLGLGMILAGAAGLAAAIAPNWNFLKEKIQSVWNSITSWWNSNVAPIFTKKYWQDKWAAVVESLPTSFKNGINAAIDLFNKFIKWINSKMTFSWKPFYIAGAKIFDGGSLQLLNIPEIPKLAKGGVIPPNAPFMAMLGDQRHGTNIEAPLSTIQEAVAVVMEDIVQSNMAGHEATVGVLREILGAVLGIHIGDDVIGQAVERYNSDMAIIRGGNG